MELILTNAFSLNMLPFGVWDTTINIRRMTRDEVRSAIRDAQANGKFNPVMASDEMSTVVSDALGIPVPRARRSVVLEPDTTMIVAQYMGPRLERGMDSVPPNGQLAYFELTHVPGLVNTMIDETTVAS